MCATASRGPAPPVTPPSSPSKTHFRSQSPPILPSMRRRRLWSPPMRRRSPTTRSRSSASSTAPRLVQLPRRLSPDAAAVSHFRPPSRSRRTGHRSHHDSRPPSTTSRPRDDADALGSTRRRIPSPSRSSSPKPAPTATPPDTPPAGRRLQSALTRPPQTQRGNRGSRSTASSILSSARKRAQARPPSPADVDRINRKLRAIAL